MDDLNFMASRIHALLDGMTGAYQAGSGWNSAWEQFVNHAIAHQSVAVVVVRMKANGRDDDADALQIATVRADESLKTLATILRDFDLERAGAVGMIPAEAVEHFDELRAYANLLSEWSTAERGWDRVPARPDKLVQVLQMFFDDDVRPNFHRRLQVYTIEAKVGHRKDLPLKAWEVTDGVIERPDGPNNGVAITQRGADYYLAAIKAGIVVPRKGNAH